MEADDPLRWPLKGAAKGRRRHQVTTCVLDCLLAIKLQQKIFFSWSALISRVIGRTILCRSCFLCTGARYCIAATNDSNRQKSSSLKSSVMCSLLSPSLTSLCFHTARWCLSGLSSTQAGESVIMAASFPLISLCLCLLSNRPLCYLNSSVTALQSLGRGEQQDGMWCPGVVAPMESSMYNTSTHFSNKTW